MTSKNVREITDLNFKKEVTDSPEPFLLDFTATWCGPCKALAPIIEKIADENVGSIRVGKLDVSDSPGIAAQYSVRGVPTVIVFKGGKEVARRTGLAEREVLMALIRGDK